MKRFYLLLTIIASSMTMTIDASSPGDKFIAYKKYRENTFKYNDESHKINQHEMPDTFSESCIKNGFLTANHGIITLQTARHFIGEFPLGLTYTLDGTREVITGSSKVLAGYTLQNHQEVIGLISITCIIGAMTATKLYGI